MNKSIMMNKKTKIIVATIFAIILLGIGGFWFWNKNNNKIIQGKESDYRIADGRVSNSKAGFSYDIPQGWSAEKFDYAEGSVFLYSPGTQVEKNENGTVKFPIKEGCLIDVGVIYNDQSVESLKVESLYFGKTIEVTTSSFEMLTVKGIPSLKYLFESPYTGAANIVSIPKNEKVYSSAVYLPADGDVSQCLEDFGNFLETVSIK
jgi:hypothetical protein